MKYFDTHCHLDRLPPEVPLLQVLHRASNAGVSRFIVPGVSGPVIESEKFAAIENVKLAWGIHPCFADEKTSDKFFENFNQRLYEPAAVGECGLDRRSSLSLEQQIRLFKQHLELAAEINLPVIVHLVGLQQAAYDLIVSFKKLPPVIMHSWSGSFEMASRFVAAGCYISFSASILKKPDIAGKILHSIDRSRLLIETDSPDMKPNFWTLSHNEPASLPQIASSLAEIAGIEVDQLAEILYTNAARVFGD